MTDIIENMSKEELVDKCTNQRIEINNLLRCYDRHLVNEVNKDQIIRLAVKHLKQDRPTVAMSTLQGYVKNSDRCLRELANGQS